MGCFLFTDYCFQMGITVMGFAKHFGQGLKIRGTAGALSGKPFYSCSLEKKKIPKRYGPECSVTGMGQFPICKLKWDF